MKCLQCEFDNPPGMKFCVNCGYSLQIQCGHCGADMLPSYRFCGECGNPLHAGIEPVTRPETPSQRPATATSRPAPSRPATAAPPEPDAAKTVAAEGERKQVTVLYCELATTAESPDEMHDLLTKFFAVAQENVERYGGTVNRHLSQGIMALFGAPVAYEDHPRRALLAALDFRKGIEEAAGEASGTWTVRMGVDTGAVVVGGIGGMAVGEATQRSESLLGLASPDEILASDATARLARDFVTLDKHDGAVGDEPVWQVTGAADLGGASSFSGPNTSPFVGRERELSVLEQLRDQAAEQQGQVIAVAGEAGSGKSRLLHELYLRTFPGSQAVSYLRGQCISYGSGVPYLPLVGMIRKASRISDHDDDDTIRHKLRRSLETVGTCVEETMPFLLRLLGVQEGTEQLDELEPLAIQARTFAAMRRMLLDAAQHALVVVEIEDLQWIDATSAEFLDSLIETMAAARLLVLLTYRSGYQPQWLEKSYATQLTMGRLSNSDSRQLVADLLAKANIPDDPSSDILDKAEGNPFFLEEMARALIDGGGQSSVPDTVQGILMARIDRLPEEHKHLLRTGSILGRELSMELLREIWDRDDDLEPLLEDLQRWELIYKAPSEDREAYFFRQALTQEVTYQSLLAPRRQELHKTAAEALERLYEQRLEDAYDRLIYHYPKAGEPKKTVHYLTEFAKKAADGYGHAEAATALREALVQAELMPEHERDVELVRILLLLADSLLPLAAFPETLELFQRHLERLEALGDPALAGPYYFWLAHTFTYLGMQAEAQEYSRKAIEAAREAGDETTEGKACYVLGRDGFWSGQFQLGIENSLRAVVLLERNGEPWWQGQAYWVAGFNHYVLGQFEDAIDALERALALGEALDDYRLDTSWSLGYFHASLGEAATGIEQCTAGLERSRDPLNSAVSTGFLGHAILQQGEDLPAAVKHLQQASELMGQAGMQQLEGWFSAFLGEAWIATGELEKAEAAAEHGLKASEEANFLYGVGLAQGSLGRVALDAGKLDVAREWLQKARARFSELEVPFEVARLDLDLGRVGRKAGSEQEAREAFTRALEGFESLQVPYWIERAQATAEA